MRTFGHGLLLVRCLLPRLHWSWAIAIGGAARGVAPARTETRALHQLNRLIALRLPERNEIQRFHGILANVLRRYLEKKLHLPARCRTTREFLELLQTCAALPDPDKEFLRHLFTACDLAKFGRADVSIDECAMRAAKIRGFIQGMVGGGPPLSGQSTLTK